MQTDKKINSEIEKLKGELSMLSTVQDQKNEGVASKLNWLEEKYNDNVYRVAQVESTMEDTNQVIDSIGNELLDLKSAVEVVDGNTADLRVTVVENINNIETKANKDFSNVKYPQLTADGVEHTSSGYTTYMTTDSKTWYIKHPTGKVECGVIVSMSGTERSFTLPVTFKNTEYSLSLQQVSWGGGTRYYIVTDKATSTFKITSSSSSSAYISIYCCGI